MTDTWKKCMRKKFQYGQILAYIGKKNNYVQLFIFGGHCPRYGQKFKYTKVLG